MTTRAHEFISRCVRAATILISGGRRPAKRKDKKAKAAHPTPNHRTIVFFEMP
jgi:hypothetical protein